MAAQNSGHATIIGVHYDDCPNAYDGHRDEATHAACPVCEAIYVHGPAASSHDMTVDYPMDNQADDEDGPEPILWCNTCNMTVWYIASDCAPE